MTPYSNISGSLRQYGSISDHCVKQEGVTLSSSITHYCQGPLMSVDAERKRDWDCVCTFVQTCLSMCVCLCVYVYVCRVYVCMSMCACICVCACVLTHVSVADCLLISHTPTARCTISRLQSGREVAAVYWGKRGREGGCFRSTKQREKPLSQQTVGFIIDLLYNLLNLHSVMQLHYSYFVILHLYIESSKSNGCVASDYNILAN